MSVLILSLQKVDNAAIKKAANGRIYFYGISNIKINLILLIEVIIFYMQFTPIDI